MVLEVYRYIFYRLNKFQRRRIKGPLESALTTILLMSFPTFLLVDMLEMHLALWVGTQSLHERFGEWLYGVSVFGALVVINYNVLVKGGRFREIMEEFRGTRPYGLGGGWVVFGFFAVPIIVRAAEMIVA